MTVPCPHYGEDASYSSMGSPIPDGIEMERVDDD